MARPQLDMPGKKFGRLLVIARHPRKGNDGQYKWDCICDCGKRTTVRGNNLRGGHTRSCGCAHQQPGVIPRAKYKKEYKAWSAMLFRCTNPKCKSYKNYGGRGIGFSPRWKSFDNFINDVGPAPSPAHSLDRIDNDKDYGPENCRWSTWNEQAINRRNSIYLELNGQRKHVTDWAKEFGINAWNITSRISLGWSVEDAITTPKEFRKKFRKNAKRHI